MKPGCLSVLSVFAFGALGAAASKYASLDDCINIYQGVTRISFPNREPETIRKIRDECRRCRQEGKCEISKFQDDPVYNQVCGCLARVRQRPVWAIASGADDAEHISSALDHGANALEMGVGPRSWWWDSRWWTGVSKARRLWADRAEDVFLVIAQKVKEGHHIGFVWLEVQWPNYYDVEDPKDDDVSLVGLMALVRKHLTPAGVPVLFSFEEVGKALNYTRQNLGPLDAIATPGTAVEAIKTFKEAELPKPQKRVMSHSSWFNNEGTVGWQNEMDAGVQSQAFRRVFTWIDIEGDNFFPELALESGVDGIAYGYSRKSYMFWDRFKVGALRTQVAICKNNLTRAAKRGDRPW